MAQGTKLTSPITYRVMRDGEEVEETVTVHEGIVRAVRVGVPLKAAAEAAGVSERIIHYWLAEAAEVAGAEKLTAKQEAVSAFAADIEKAQGQAIAFNIGIIRQAARKQWTAAAWWLERRYPDDFGRRIHVKEEGERKPAPLERDSVDEYEAAYAAAYGDGVPELDAGELVPPELPEG